MESAATAATAAQDCRPKTLTTRTTHWAAPQAGVGDGGMATGMGFGGGLYCDGTSSVSIINSVFSHNLSGRTARIGGYGGLLGTGAPLDPNAEDGHNGDIFIFGDGAGLYFDQGALADVNGTMVIHNQALDYVDIGGIVQTGSGVGGGILCLSQVTINLVDSAVEDNTGIPGVLCGTANLLNATGCSFARNEGGIYVDMGSNGALANCVFADNVATTSGGGLYWARNGGIQLTGCTFRDNTASGDAGGFYCERSILTMEDCEFTGNIGANGGGFAALNRSTVDMHNCLFAANTAGGAGGAMHMNNGGVTASDCRFIANRASHGGALSLYTSSDTTSFLRCTIHGNSASNRGGGLYGFSSPLALTHTIITNNYASSSGGAMYFMAERQVVHNCLMTGNASGDTGGAVWASFSAPAFSNCTISGNSAHHAGGGFFCGDFASVNISNSIIDNCNNYAIYEDKVTGDVSVTYTLFH
ncbi:MAG: right-handed parallel beta-helix repeat-containing protein, partial [Planctomycetota bacterium]